MSLKALLFMLFMCWTSNFTPVLVSLFCPIYVNFGVDDGAQVHPIILLMHIELFFVLYHYNKAIYFFQCSTYSGAVKMRLTSDEGNETWYCKVQRVDL